MKEKGRKKECTDPDARTTAMENERGREIQRERETGKEGGRSTCTGKEGERSTCNTVILPKSTTHQTSYLRVP